MILRNCPICNIPLEAETYEGFEIQCCPQCRGHLLQPDRFTAIQRLPEKSLAELEAEAKAGFTGDTAAILRCPRCRLRMTKLPLAVPGFDLHYDLCSACQMAWLDGGELALAQLAHQATPGFRDAQEQKRRHAELENDPERKAAFEQAVAKLPLPPNPFHAGLDEALREALYQIAIGHPGCRVRP